MTQLETHEPDEPIDWPHGHVGVREPSADEKRIRPLRLNDVDVEITDADADECMVITLGDHNHYLHSTTTRALSDLLAPFGSKGRAAAVTIHGVQHVLNSKASRSLSLQLRQRLDEWNRERGLPWLPTV